MEHQFPESEWKTFRELRQVALERFCKRVLEEVPPFLPDSGRSYHERFLELFRWLGERNDDLARTFDDPPLADALAACCNLRSRPSRA